MSAERERQETARAYLLGSADVKARVAAECVDAILAAADIIGKAFRSGGKLMLCGNGGSAADCQHMAAEFVSRFTKDVVRPGLPAIALTTDTSFLTAFANDYGFDDVFARQVQALGRAGDVLMAISTSGSSVNVIRALSAARAARVRTIVLTGQVARLATMADVMISVPSRDTQHIQEAHLTIEHLICYLVERDLFVAPAQASDAHTAHADDRAGGTGAQAREMPRAARERR